MVWLFREKERDEEEIVESFSMSFSRERDEINICSVVFLLGNVWRTTIRIVAALIGPGILLFPGAMACLGWVFGLAATLLFSSVTCLSTHLLAYCYGSGGGTNGSYVDAAKTILGKQRIQRKP